MRKRLFFLAIIMVISGMTYGQDTLTQAERNRQKIAELRSKLSDLSEDSVAGLEGETIIPRLIRIEEKLDGLIADMEALKKQSQTSVTPQKLDSFLKQLEGMLGTEAKEEQTAQSGIASGKYYVVLESQRTLELAQTAKEMYSRKSGEKLKIVKSQQHNWYYLVVPKSDTYDSAGKRIVKEREEGVKAWRVRDSLVTDI